MKAYIVVCAAAFLGACAQISPSIHYSSEDLSRCQAAARGCSVWTEEELSEFGAGVIEAWRKYQEGSL